MGEQPRIAFLAPGDIEWKVSPGATDETWQVAAVAQAKAYDAVEMAAIPGGTLPGLEPLSFSAWLRLPWKPPTIDVEREKKGALDAPAG